MKRLDYIDVARGIAMICIILGHLGIPEIDRVVYAFHVPIFFLITGFFTNTKYSKKDFIKKKARTLLVPYCITCLVIILLGTIKGYITGGFVEAKNDFLNWGYASLYGIGRTQTKPFHIVAIGAIWFLWATFWASIFLRFILDRQPKFRMLIVIALFFVGYLSKSLLCFPLSIQAGCCATLFMYLGYLINISKDKIFSLPKEIKIFIVTFALITFISYIKENIQNFSLVYCDFGRGIVDIFGSICACFIVIIISYIINQKFKKLSNGLIFLGKYSLIMLCVHIIELNLFPWDKVINKILILFKLPTSINILLKIIGKLIFIITMTVILAKWNFSRKIFGYKKDEKIEEEKKEEKELVSVK